MTKVKCNVAGHTYTLPFFENPEHGQVLQFIHKEPTISTDGSEQPVLKLIADGTTNEAVLEALIDRMKFLQDKFPCRENAIVITKLEESLMWLEKITKDRLNRGVEGKHLK
jgi:hypothetical protein